MRLHLLRREEGRFFNGGLPHSHDYFMAKLPDLLANPDRMGTGLHGHPRWSKIPEALVCSGWIGSGTASVYDLAVLVEGAVMAPDVPKVDADRGPDPGTSVRAL